MVTSNREASNPMLEKMRSAGGGRRVSVAAVLAFIAAIAASTIPTMACGGFFCRQVPIDQAGEQIIFRQDGDQVTAVILIQYVGDAEDFSWVVPVPGIPDLSVGSDLVFQPLERATRPQFNLLVDGAPCFNPLFFLGGFAAAPTLGLDSLSAADGGVEILQRLAVGPFDVEVVTSDDAEALAVWLDENGYDLDDRGAELIAPYVDEGMNFVALKLRQNQGVGDIQPLIMRYTSVRPMIPIRLTAVAAQPDMGIIVWMLGDARAVPVNYLSIEPNLTRLDWFSGPFNAFASYQDLVTEAMDEAGGQGFATDFAAPTPDLSGVLPDPASLRDELDALRRADAATFHQQLFFGFVFPQTKVLEILRRELPLPAGVDESNYAEVGVLNEILGADLVSAARESILAELETAIIGPLEETRGVLEGKSFMTRLFTTLSPEEMTLDPVFAFNGGVPDQPIERQATLELSCFAGQTRWTLTLGAGTGREGEVVIRGTGDSPLFGPQPQIAQAAVARSAMVPAEGDPEIVTDNMFSLVDVRSTSSGDIVPVTNPIDDLLALCGNGMLGASLMSFAALTLFAVSHRRGTWKS